MAEALKDFPEVFTLDPGKLEGLEGLYLGQPKEEALEVMKGMCKRLIELDGGRFRGGTYFRGCHTPSHPQNFSFRVGFNPRIGDAVFTLEVKRKTLSQSGVRARAWERIEGIDKELFRRGIVRIEAKKYNFLANWDDGKNGPTHIILGYSEPELERISAGSKE